MAITQGFVNQLFRTSTVQRWTDHLRPMDLTALGKHAHTAVIAWVLGRWAERFAGWSIDWDYLIRGNLLELLRVSVLTDIMSTLYEEIRKDAEDRKNLDIYVAARLASILKGCPPEIREGLLDYYENKHGSTDRWNAYTILRAASALASVWEFRLIEQANPRLYDLAQTHRHVEEGIRRYQYVPGVLELHENRNDLSQFIDHCGRLRFQMRWSHTPIVPPRPVLDHELLVAYLSYACIADSNGSHDGPHGWRRYHAFFGGLFHDLPEVFTRDVVSPVKHGAKIDGILKKVERSWFQRRLEPMLPDWLYHELSFFALDEFSDKTWPPSDWPDHLECHDSARKGTAHPGSIIEVCDEFVGFMEAFKSIQFGVSSDELEAAVDRAKKIASGDSTDVAASCDLKSLYGDYLGLADLHDETATGPDRVTELERQLLDLKKEVQELKELLP